MPLFVTDMLPYRDVRITKIILALFFLLVAIYAYYEARGLLFGPSISVPDNPSIVQDRFITIHGKAERIAQLTMNGRPVTVTEDGAFDEPFLLSDGYNRIVLRAQDRYGRARENVIELMYEPATSTPAPTSATSTVAQ
jgi:hypothetical protein